MIDFTTLAGPELPSGPKIPVVGTSRISWITALIIVLAVFAIGMIVFGVYQNQVNGTKKHQITFKNQASLTNGQ